MKKHSISLILILFFSFLLDGCKLKEETLNPEIKPEISENVIQISSNTDKVVAFKDNILTVKGLAGFSGSRVAASDIKIGSVIEAEPSTILPDGLLVKVINVSPSQQYGVGYNNLEIIPAKLEDYITNCPKSESKETFIAESVTTEPNVTYKIMGQSVELEIQKTFNHSVNTPTEKGSVKVSGKIVFERDLKLGLAIEKSEIKYFKYEIINKDKLDIKITGEYTLEKEKEFTLAKIKGKRIKFLLGGIPVWVKPIFKVGLKLTAKGGVKLEAEIIKFEKEYVRGAEYTGGVWRSLDVDKPKDETPLKRDIDLNGEAKVALNAGFEGAFYEGLVSLGLEGEVFGQINSRISFNEPLKADFKAGIDFKVNIESSIFSKKLVAFNFIFASWEIRRDIIDLKKESEFSTTGLVAYYPFNGNADDESGNKNDGTVNGATLTTDRYGNPNKAYSFDGNSYIEIPHSTSLNLNNITLSVWVNAKSSNEVVSYLITKGWDSQQNYGMYVNNGNKGVGLQGRVGSNWTGVNSSTNTLKLNLWNHVVGIFDGVKFIIYINGIKSEELIANGTLSANSQSLFLGRNSTIYGGYPYWLNGFLDDVRIYNRALNDTEVQALYLAEKP